ncbi:MAG TPA: hypothetical protein VN911_18495 [Candidatus Acidoferrum sp.]|jgi:hypothetical protein|nr:hypothetical protein [Candidatus Acidoferrum sp.]
MARKGRVGVLLRINTGDGKYTYIKPVWDGNKLKPLVGIIAGKEVHRPEGRYYLRYTELGKNHLEPVGNDPADVLIGCGVLENFYTSFGVKPTRSVRPRRAPML